MNKKLFEDASVTASRKARIGWWVGVGLVAVVALAIYATYPQRRAALVAAAKPTEFVGPAGQRVMSYVSSRESMPASVVSGDPGAQMIGYRRASNSIGANTKASNAAIAVDPAAQGVMGYLRTHELVGGGSAVFVPASEKLGQIALTGADKRYFGVPARVWVADGLTQIRDLGQTGTFAFSGPGITLAGPETTMTNATLGDDGNGFTWGTATYTDEASGLTCSGPFFGKITNALAHLTVVAKCSDGALLKGSVQDVESYPAGVAPPTWVRSEFKGVLSKRQP
ncbi:MAG: hypothetical protein U0641_14335 [Anaerolineae bacterium]